MNWRLRLRSSVECLTTTGTVLEMPQSELQCYSLHRNRNLTILEHLNIENVVTLVYYIQIMTRNMAYKPHWIEVNLCSKKQINISI